MATVTVPPSTGKALAAPKSHNIGYEIRCRRCGYVHSGRVAQLSESMERPCPTGCGAIVCVSAYLLAPAFTPPHQQEFDLALWPSKVERTEAAPASPPGNTPRDRARS